MILALLVPCLFVVTLFAGIGYTFRHREAIEAPTQSIEVSGRGVYRNPGVVRVEDRLIETVNSEASTEELIQWIDFIAKPFLKAALKDGLRRGSSVTLHVCKGLRGQRFEIKTFSVLPVKR